MGDKTPNYCTLPILDCSKTNCHKCRKNYRANQKHETIVSEKERVKGECERIVDGLRKKSNQIKSTEKTIVSTTDEKGEEIPAVIYLLDDKLFDAALDKIRAL